MSELLFVTVGTTAIKNRKIGGGNLADKAAQYLDQRTDPDKNSFARRHNLKHELMAAHADFWKQCGEDGPAPDEFDKTSAELTSTMALLEQEQSITSVIFLGSETAEGLLAMEVNCAVLREIWTRGKVFHKLIPGLEKKFTRVTPKLEAILQEFDALSASCVHFNITGGFKGVIPSITFLATLHHGWSIYYQFEGLSKAAKVFFSRVDPTAPPVLEEEEEDWET